MMQCIAEYKNSFIGFFTYVIGNSLSLFLESLGDIPALIAPIVSLLTLTILFLTVIKMIDEYLRKEFKKSIFQGFISIFDKRKNNEKCD